MALTKEDLENIRTPLSDKDYVMLHNEEVETSFQVWDLAPKELRIYYLLKFIECFDKRYPGNRLLPEEMTWVPPLTEEFEDYPKGEKIPILTREDFQNIKLPLSDIDYLRLRAFEESDDREEWNLRQEFPEIWKAFDWKESDYFDIRFPGNCAVMEDIFWVMPPTITAENVDEIEDPIAKKVAIRHILKDAISSLMWQKALNKFPDFFELIGKLKKK